MIEDENKKKSLGFRLDEIKEIDEEIKTLQNTSKKVLELVRIMNIELGDVKSYDETSPLSGKLIPNGHKEENKNNDSYNYDVYMNTFFIVIILGLFVWLYYYLGLI
jgi:hypothetical protein